MKALITTLCCALTLTMPVSGWPESREKTALVLAGGGARGIAHVGAITALEEMQIPVDAIAGTSMGALVGGLYAIGMDSEELQLVIQNMAWDEAFEDSLNRGDLPQRRKSDDYDYPASIAISIKDGKASIPLGFAQGQQVRQMIKELMLEAEHIKDFDAFPTPYRAVATDIETGEAYVFDSGNVVTAMRASMSLPGLLAPVEHDGRLLLDGGMAMNIPVSVGRQMGANRLIVIDIGTPLKSRDEITSVLSIADQMVGFLTRKNSLEQLATLRERDLLINPDLTGIGMLDFDQTELIFQRGYEATMAMREQLLPLALDDSRWATYQASRALPEQDSTPIVSSIAINNNGSIRDDIIRVRLRQQLGEPLNRDQLQEDLATVYALDYWEIIDYDMVPIAGQDNQLTITARSKSWGKGRLKMGLNLVTDMDGSSDVNIGTSYLRKGLTDLGGEIYGRAQVGDTIIFDAHFYQPLDLKSRFFAVPYIGYKDTDVLTIGPEYQDNDSIGSWRVRRLSADFNLGWNLFENSALRLGLFRNGGEYEPDIEIGQQLPKDSFQEGGVMLSYHYDNLDNAFFPTNGGFLYGEYLAYRSDLGSDDNFERWYGTAQAAYSFGADSRNTVILTGRTGQSTGAPNEPQNYYQLGGLFNLSGLSQNFFSGRQMAFAMAQYQRRLSDNSVLPIDMPVYVGASIEGGQLWSDRSDVSSGEFINAGSIYLAMDSPVGPIYLAYGRSQDSQDALYIALGWPFLSNQMRMGR